ncbi:MAG: aspartate-semialdehyde dehydrogenase [Bifidobacteriaceae bacterium]|jgi:aspartate-semialdehyde dehydrogenase|nr:aspartate-semialdehyde dehydrogenase [Bifidobacteriaceae bacterium]
MKKVRLGIIGATGLVGTIILRILQEQNFPIQDLRLFASANSTDRIIHYASSQLEKDLRVEDLNTQNADTVKNLDIAIFSAGATVSKKWAPVFAQAGVVVIDNSSAWRSDPRIPLVVSEVNPKDVRWALATGGKHIIANPNCTTMAMMPILATLNQHYKLNSIIVSTYQAVSGAGQKGVNELASQAESMLNDGVNLLLKGTAFPMIKPDVFAAPIAFNVLPYAGNFLEDNSGETDEERKLRDESRKILHLAKLKVAGTCVRVPVFTGHSLSVNAVFQNNLTPRDVIEILTKTSGVSLTNRLTSRYFTRAQDMDIATSPASAFPTPLLAVGHDPVYIGRIRQDLSRNDQKGINFFAVCDNLRKGAALNAIELAKIVMKYLS